MSAFAALAMLGPGRWSIDGLMGIRLPRWMVAATGVGVAAGIVVALVTRTPAEPPAQAEQAAPDTDAMAEAAAASQEREVELRAAGTAPSRRRVEAEQGA
jgi:hypothetical protein